MSRTGPCHLAALDEQTLLIEFMARHNELREYIAKRTRNRLPPQTTPDEVLQEVYISAFRAMSTYRWTGPDAFDRWLMGIVNHRLVDIIKTTRRLKRGGRAGLGSDALDGRNLPGDAVSELRAPGRTPSSECAAREATQALQSALSRLPADRQTAVRLHHLENRPIRQIARRMQKSEAAVKSLLVHGLADLRRLLGSPARYFSDAGSDDESGEDEAPKDGAAPP